MTAPGTPNTTIDRRNFHHMVMDIFWFGLAFPSTSRFLAVYAIRLGATPFEVGLLTALPALALVIAAMFSIRWRARFTNSGDAIILPSLGHRFIFLLPALTPFMPTDFQSIWLILALTLPAIPQGVASVVFLAPLLGTTLLSVLPVVPVLLGGAALRLGAGFLVQFSPARGMARRSRRLIFRARALRS